MLSARPVLPILLATDLAASRAFYEDKLGLVVETASDEAVTYLLAGESRLRLTASTEGTKDSQTQAAFLVDDVRAAVTELRERGVTFEEYDNDEVKTEDGVADQGEALVAWVTDPGGNVVGIEQPK